MTAGPAWQTRPSAYRLLSRSVHDEMLRSTVRLSRLIFSASAASIFLYDEETGTLTFEASSGIGEDQMIGVSIPAESGIAGWVLGTCETVLIKDVATDHRFDRAFADSTGLVPDVIMAAPLVMGESPIGVIEVLDPKTADFGDLSAIDVLTELASQSCNALSLMNAARDLQSQTPQASVDEAIRYLTKCAHQPVDRDGGLAADLIVAMARILDRQQQ